MICFDDSFMLKNEVNVYKSPYRYLILWSLTLLVLS